jgi:hypothetical protein
MLKVNGKGQLMGSHLQGSKHADDLSLHIGSIQV